MIELDVIITGVVGLFSTIIGSWTSWFFTRKKYNSEVDSTLINNMKESLDFYERLSNDNRERLDEVLKRNIELEQEVAELKKQMFNVMSSICTDLSCQLRKRSFNLFNEQNGAANRKKVEKTKLHDK